MASIDALRVHISAIFSTVTGGILDRINRKSEERLVSPRFFGIGIFLGSSLLDISPISPISLGAWRSTNGIILS